MLRVHNTVWVIALGAGCRHLEEQRDTYPEADFSASSIDFGDVDWGDSASRELVITNSGGLPMGISGLYLRSEEMEENFALSYDAAGVSCPEGGDADAKAATDSGGETGGGGGGGGGEDTGGEGEEDAGGVLVLDPGCELAVNLTLTPVAVGEIHQSVILESATEDVETGYPTYYRDPDGFKKVVTLEGVGVKGLCNVVVSPRSVDFGHVWDGESDEMYVSVRNVGDGDCTLLEPSLSATCDAGFEIAAAWTDGTPLAAETSTAVTLSFAPADTDAAYCQMMVTSDDPDTPQVEVNLKANSGEDPENETPTCAIRSPEPGYLHNSAEDVEVEVNVFDVNQPADTLFCKIWSNLLQGYIATCTPGDESGHVFVDVPLDDLETGVDTWVLTVRDSQSKECTSSTTVLYRTSYPDEDDDGDGFGADDCNDANRDSYPAGAEVYDGDDNDCDGLYDEGTEGSDDDGDAVSEVEGDCDDDDGDTYPGAPEQADQKDNDCDGSLDEGTSLNDDDGDGFAEVDNDCNDADPAVNPASTEYCDGIDNDCNGLKDNQDGCVALDSEPIIVGGINMAKNAIGVGESTTMCVSVYDADGQEISYTWTQDSDLNAINHNAIDNPAAECINFAAPPKLSEGSEGEIYKMYVIAMDEDGHQVWSFDEITVFPEPVAAERVVAIKQSGCGSGGDEEAIFLVPALFGIGALRRRRR